MNNRFPVTISLRIAVLQTTLAVAAVLCPHTAPAFHPLSGDYSRDNALYVRLMTWNVHGQFPNGTGEQNAAFNRILTLINPDIICFQELNATLTPSEVAARLQAVLGGTWAVNLGVSDGYNRNGLATRFALLDERDDTIPPSDVRGVTMGLVKLTANPAFNTDLYVMCAHFKASEGTDNDARRQVHADAIAHWFGDLRTPGGEVTLSSGTPIILAGDLNLASTYSQQPYLTLITGDIQDETTFGPDIKGDWDNSDLADVWPANNDDFDYDSWSSSGPTQRLDRIIYTDSAVNVAQSFILNTRTMTAAQLAATGLSVNDTASAYTSDHLPLVVDFAVAPVAITEPQWGAVIITEFMADPNGSDAEREWFELFNPGTTPIDINGWGIHDTGGSYHRIDAGGPLLIMPKAYRVLARHADPAINGGVPADLVYNSVVLSNTGPDELELYRGSIKIDGVRFNGGSEGLGPANVDWGGVKSGSSRIMTGNYQNGRTANFADSTIPYGDGGNGSPGALNEFSVAPPGQMFYLY
ncbi:MAG: hypothetical protein Kow0059_14020 [Candidatus Sumerlaeia bacterium]